MSEVKLPLEFKILQFKPSELASQIVLMDSFVFRQITPRECIAQAWKKVDKWERASNLLRMINQFNSVCRWVQLAILGAGKSSRDRAKMLKHMILVAQSLLEAQDFSALCAVHGALVSTPVKRCKKGWKRLSAKYIKRIEGISTLFQWNSPKLVNLHSTSKGPVIPHLGIILKNVISIEESDEYRPDGTVNRHKMNLLAEQVEKLMLWQRQCSLVHSADKRRRKINKKNRRFLVEPDYVLQKLLHRDFVDQVNVTEDDIFKMSPSR